MPSFFAEDRRGPVGSCRRLLASAALVLFAVGGGAAADQQAESPTPFAETLDVRVVNVEVVVTDRAGRRVEGLSADDFRLIVDGAEVPVTYFSEVRDGRERMRAEGAAAEPGPAEPPAAAEPPGFADRVPTQVLVFIDDAFSIARDRDRVLGRLAADLSVLGVGDRVAVVAFDGRRVEPLLGWSGDLAAIRGALAAAAERPTHGLRPLAPPALEGRSLREAAESPRRLGDFELEGQLDRLVSAGAAAMRAAGRPDGRRVMLLLSGGWPFSTFSALPVGTTPRPDLHVRGDVLFAPLIDAANLLGYTLYPVDVPGMTAVDLISPEHATPRRAIVDGEHHGSLYYLAAQTGGRAMINGRRSEALRRVAHDVSSYYWLGFTPPRRGDDRRHDIRIEIAGGGLAARARDSYLDLSRATDEAMRLEGMLLFGAVAGGEVAGGGLESGGRAAGGGLEVELGAPRPEGRRTADVPVRVSFPIDALEAVPVGDAWRVTGELRVAALDRRSRLSRVPMVPIDLELAEPPAPGERFTWEGTLALRRVDQVVAASLADRSSGRTLVTRIHASP